MSWVREAYQTFVSIRTCELLGTASSKEKTPSSVPVFRENKCVFSVKILLFQIYLINTQVSIYLYIQSVHSTTVNRAPCSSSFRQVCTQCLISDTRRWTANRPKSTSQGCRHRFYQVSTSPHSQSGPPDAQEPPCKSEARFFWGHGHWLQVGLLIC